MQLTNYRQHTDTALNKRHSGGELLATGESNTTFY